jgi:radical SAM protein with 4Fe4S-binding SPASM domain
VNSRMTEAQVAAFPDLLAHLNSQFRGELSLRIDCALVPFLVQDSRFSPAQLEAAGVYGCEADRRLLAVQADGQHAPCSFLTKAARDPAASVPAAPPLIEPCASCTYRAVCRGGCRVVASGLRNIDSTANGATATRAATGEATAFAPDPECPRVIRHRRASLPLHAAHPSRANDA